MNKSGGHPLSAMIVHTSSTTIQNNNDDSMAVEEQGIPPAPVNQHATAPINNNPATDIEYVELRKEDILCGRGSGPNERAGNIEFRNLVLSRKEEYVAIPARDHADKTRIAHEVIATIKERGARFLKYAPKKPAVEGQPREPDRYILADEKTILEKTKQALRQHPSAGRREHQAAARQEKRERLERERNMFMLEEDIKRSAHAVATLKDPTHKTAHMSQIRQRQHGIQQTDNAAYHNAMRLQMHGTYDEHVMKMQKNYQQPQAVQKPGGYLYPSTLPGQPYFGTTILVPTSGVVAPSLNGHTMQPRSVASNGNNASQASKKQQQHQDVSLAAQLQNPNQRPSIDLPDGWRCVWSKTQQRWYFFHERMGSCWDLTSVASAIQAAGGDTSAIINLQKNRQRYANDQNRRPSISTQQTVLVGQEPSKQSNLVISSSAADSMPRHEKDAMCIDTMRATNDNHRTDMQLGQYKRPLENATSEQLALLKQKLEYEALAQKRANELLRQQMEQHGLSGATSRVDDTASFRASGSMDIDIMKKSLLENESIETQNQIREQLKQQLKRELKNANTARRGSTATSCEHEQQTRDALQRQIQQGLEAATTAATMLLARESTSDDQTIGTISISGRSGGSNLSALERLFVDGQSSTQRSVASVGSRLSMAKRHGKSSNNSRGGDSGSDLIDGLEDMSLPSMSMGDVSEFGASTVMSKRSRLSRGGGSKDSLGSGGKTIAEGSENSSSLHSEAFQEEAAKARDFIARQKSSASVSSSVEEVGSVESSKRMEAVAALTLMSSSSLPSKASSGSSKENSNRSVSFMELQAPPQPVAVPVAVAAAPMVNMETEQAVISLRMRKERKSLSSFYRDSIKTTTCDDDDDDMADS